MEKQKVDMFISMNAGNFQPYDLMMIKDRLEKMDDDKFYLVQGLQFQKPDTIFLLAFLLGIERFWLDDVVLGILKVITCYGCLIWWIIDIISAKERTYKYNLQQFNKAVSFI